MPDLRDPNWMKGIAGNLRFPPKEEEMTEQLSPERAVRVLRAKAAELENQAKAMLDPHHHNDLGYLVADISLVAELLAEHIERWNELSHRFESFRSRILNTGALDG